MVSYNAQLLPVERRFDRSRLRVAQRWMTMFRRCSRCPRDVDGAGRVDERGGPSRRVVVVVVAMWRRLEESTDSCR